MKDKIKYLIVALGILGILVGRILSRVLTNYYGNKASNIVVAVSTAFVVCVILLLIIIAQYLAAITFSIMLIPLIISGIGLYLNKMNLLGLSIVSMLIIYPILAIVLKKMKRSR